MTNRRQWLQWIGTAAASAWGASLGFTQDKLPATGRAAPELAGFDRLMTSFIEERRVPGAALAISHNGALVYARGFGYADVEKKEPVEPHFLFRIASVSKPITAVAVLQLVESNKLRLDDKILDRVPLQPHLEAGKEMDPRWKQITVLHCLQHTGGWDRNASFDPIAKTWNIAKTLQITPPVKPEHVIRYMMGNPLDFDPGRRYAYSNFGYLLLGRVIENVSSMPYETYVRDRVLKPLGIGDMQLGKARLENRTPGEVKYYDHKKRTGRAVTGPNVGEIVPVQYGAENLEGYDAHGGWIASAVDLARFVAAFDDVRRCPLLKEATIQTMWGRPDGRAGFNREGRPRPSYYGCGWQVRPVKDEPRLFAWHAGLISGTSSLIVHRPDGINWAVLFNTDHAESGAEVSKLIDPLLHEKADEVKSWPDVDRFGEFLPKRAK